MHKIIHGDSEMELGFFEDNSIDSVVTDPPYGISFMNKHWDYDVPTVDLWREVYRVLKPGGHALVACGTRTQHRMAVNLEDAGFEIRDVIAWVYGCLSADTEVLTEFGFMSYERIRKTKNIRILAYDPKTDAYHYETPEKWNEYQVKDTCFRVQSDHTDQIVSRNHRCLIERKGDLLFEFAENIAQEREASIPFLESVPVLRDSVPGLHKGAGRPEQSVQPGLCCENGIQSKTGEDKADGAEENGSCEMRELRERNMEAVSVAEESKNPDLLAGMQRRIQGQGMEIVCAHGPEILETGFGGCSCSADDGVNKPGVERRNNVSEEKGVLRGSATEIREMPGGICADGAKGWIRTGIQTSGCSSDIQAAYENGSGSPHRPQPDEQRAAEPDAICHEQGSQTLRSRKSYKTTLATFTPIVYIGIIFCPTVSTGAFVARRNGKIFITGNSGFPKSLDISKAIDKAAGAERGVVGRIKRDAGSKSEHAFENSRELEYDLTAPATDEAKQWDGWGTALKPAMELWTLARKPLGEKTVAANVLKHGTGGLNIDGCRVETDEVLNYGTGKKSNVGFKTSLQNDNRPEYDGKGRFPANLIHDGSDEVVGLFPDTKSGKMKQDIEGGEFNVYGKQYPRSVETIGDSGSAARFFYCAKASKADRNEGLEEFELKPKAQGNQAQAELKRGNIEWDAGTSGMNKVKMVANNHPTVKPTALMRYLVRLITPPGGTVLDPFAGSGSTGKGAILEGFDVVLIERDEQYIPIIEGRCAHAAAQVETLETVDPLS